MDFCCPSSHQLSFDHHRRPHQCVESCRLCNDEGMAICSLWKANASVDLNRGCCICLERGVYSVHRHFNSRYLWNKSSFCTVCNSDDCRVEVDRRKTLFTSSVLAEMQFQALGVILGVMLMSIMKMVELYCQVCEITYLFFSFLI